MKEKTWFEKILDSVKDSFEFRLEKIILHLTEQICKRMQDKQISRTQLARALNVSPAAVTKILNGNSNFTLRTLLSLGDALNLDLAIEFWPKETSAQGPFVTWAWPGEAELGIWAGKLQHVTVTTAWGSVSSVSSSSAASGAKLIAFPEQKREQLAA